MAAGHVEGMLMKMTLRIALCAVALLAFSAVSAADGSQWRAAGDLITPRTGHTATLLQDGRVLVVGGVTNGDDLVNVLDSAELYDPGTGAWNVTGRLSRPRSGHTAARLLDGRVLVAGGCNTFAQSPERLDDCVTAELYDPATETWSSTGNLTARRIGSTATLLSTGQVLVAGGSCCSAESYDPITGTWSPVGGFVDVYRDQYTATLLPNGQVLAAGGSIDADLLFGVSTAESYDPVASGWSATGDLNVARATHTATLLPNGKVLAAGGYTLFTFGHAGHTRFANGLLFAHIAELFDPATGGWAKTGALNVGRFGHTATLLADGQVLLAGGATGFPSAGTDSAELYHPIRETWTSTASLNTARIGHSATVLLDGTVLVAGGNAVPFAVLKSAELYVARPLCDKNHYILDFPCAPQ